ncbi:MAG: hypothetical protein ABJD24_17735, partial [Acidimicrobiales bacterium]
APKSLGDRQGHVLGRGAGFYVHSTFLPTRPISGSSGRAGRAHTRGNGSRRGGHFAGVKVADALRHGYKEERAYRLRREPADEPRFRFGFRDRDARHDISASSPLPVGTRPDGR